MILGIMDKADLGAGDGWALVRRNNNGEKKVAKGMMNLHILDANWYLIFKVSSLSTPDGLPQTKASTSAVTSAICLTAIA